MAVQLPPFTYDIDLWLAHIDACWPTNDDTITDPYKFRLTVAALPAQIAARISTLLTDPPATARYDALKVALKQACGRTTELAMEELHTITYDGGRPSVFLERLKDLNRAAGSPMSDALVMFRHKQSLPPHVRAPLTLLDITDISEYAKKADRLFHALAPQDMAAGLVPPGSVNSNISNQSARVYNVDNSAPIRVCSDNACASTDAIARASTARPAPADTLDVRLARVEGMLEQLVGAGGVRDPPPPRRRAYCFYHTTFGPRARNCSPPCTWFEHQPWSRGTGNAASGRR
ncbi:uncharacterized protein LOC143039722 [Oratosquilla oratoria]|uniref:uncharacterized protein LOC143039722 n=1 Tax=Oratosquilla oratoria TaxID=337810 RepID=UPI003F75FB82